MSVKLTKAVLAGGRVFPAGTVRDVYAAEVIGDGPWWGGASSEEPPIPTEEGPDAGDSAEEPPRSGRGSGVDAWRAYAGTLGIDVPDDATRDDIVALVDNN